METTLGQDNNVQWPSCLQRSTIRMCVIDGDHRSPFTVPPGERANTTNIDCVLWHWPKYLFVACRVLDCRQSRALAIARAPPLAWPPEAGVCLTR